ncbi:two-component system sensor histidine kinase KdpD [Pseudomonas oryzihabitans]|uniref:histidine kinase n=1 Tax=Pseudomonas flavocrustae TaxID=2991719 RepID=A0ABT6IFS1_9PSED|nr:sensor histidine kinase KdpD [Pseudomonas sp. CBMAI 2609]MDH4763196.1 sensor histidine kinase KdpD [Pseudomonas sp. CBMAI 2609]
MTDSTGRAEALLAEHREGRGRLKVFLGAAPGVGKTYAMLQAAQTALRQGRRVRAGIVETHGRRETAALLAGLPQQPLRRVEHRGLKLTELDLEGLLADPPELVLVDELAHSNVPGSRHAKRWQDVADLLAAGIHVYTTVNVQHLESLNDEVRDITGVQVRETVPDQVLLDADDLVLIDLPPRELLERLREGKVYVPEQARAAIDAFFSQTNLTALRELAMRTAAAQVDSALALRYRQQGQAAPPLLGRLIVGAGTAPSAERLVRHASRLADQRHLPWTLVHVDTGQPLDDTARANLQASQRLAERLGGEVLTLRDTDPARALVRHARDQRASVLLIGRGRPRGFSLRRRLASRLLRLAQGLEIAILDLDRDAPPTARPRRALRPGPYGAAVLATAVAAVIAEGLSGLLELPNISLIFLAAVLLVAVRSSRGPALFCALLGFLAYDFLFIPPAFSLTINREQDVLTLAFFLLMALLTGDLAARQRRQLQALRRTQRETLALLDFTRQLSAASDRQAVVSVTLKQLGDATRHICLLLPEKAGQLVPQPGDLLLADHERIAAEWAWKQEKPAGCGTDTLPSGGWWWWPLLGEGGSLAVLGVRRDDAQPLDHAERRQLASLAQPLAQALARVRLSEDLEAARLHGETEQLRSALLASVSHDLRTPLTVMRGSIDALATLGDAIPASDRQELLDATRQEAERLDRYIQNLLDMTRLGHGSLQLARDWVDPGDILASALQRLQPLLSGLQVATRIEPGLPLLWVHPALIEQALVNVLENAIRFSAPGGRLEISVLRQGNELQLAVADEGPGIPPEDRTRIFDMFYTAARGDRGGQGTGLGLAICQGMVGAHGGRVSVEDGLDGRGTTLRMHLPLPAPPAE